MVKKLLALIQGKMALEMGGEKIYSLIQKRLRQSGQKTPVTNQEQANSSAVMPPETAREKYTKAFSQKGLKLVDKTQPGLVTQIYGFNNLVKSQKPPPQAPLTFQQPSKQGNLEELISNHNQRLAQQGRLLQEDPNKSATTLVQFFRKKPQYPKPLSKKVSEKGFAFLPILIWAAIILFTGTAAVKSGLIQVGNNIPTESPTPAVAGTEVSFPLPSYSPTSPPLPTKTTYVDPDPIINCGPGQNSKQYVKDRSSNCKNYVDCGLSGNTVWTLMLNTECNKKHAEENQQLQQVINYYTPPPTNTGNYTPTNNSTSNLVDCPADTLCNGNPQIYHNYSPADCASLQKQTQATCQLEVQQAQQSAAQLQQIQQQNAAYRQKALADCHSSADATYQQCQKNCNDLSQEYQMTNGLANCMASCQLNHDQQSNNCELNK